MSHSKGLNLILEFYPIWMFEVIKNIFSPSMIILYIKVGIEALKSYDANTHNTR